MSIKSESITRILSDNARRYALPPIQRAYVWDTKNCEQLWESVLRVMEHMRREEAAKSAENSGVGTRRKKVRTTTMPVRQYQEYLGAIVYTERDEHQKDVNLTAYDVIDGQQRLTTVTLLISALIAEGRASDSPTVGLEDFDLQTAESYILLPGKKGDDRFKIILGNADRSTLMYLLDSSLPEPERPSRELYANHAYFRSVIREVKEDYSLLRIWNALSRLTVTPVELDRHSTDPYLVFQSLNNRGTRLTDMDLVKASVITELNHDERHEANDVSWRSLEENFAKLKECYIKAEQRKLSLRGDSARILSEDKKSRMQRDYLDVRMPEYIKIYVTLRSRSASAAEGSSPYSSFRGYVDYSVQLAAEHEDFDQPSHLMGIIKDFTSTSRYYCAILFPEDYEEDAEVVRKLRHLAELDLTGHRALILQAYELWKGKKLSKVHFLSVLELIESYIVRIYVSAQKLSSVDKVLKKAATTYASAPDGVHYPSHVLGVLSDKTYRTYPSDESVRRGALELQYKPDKGQRRLTHILRRLEISEDTKKNYSELDERFTIEHVAPQSISDSPRSKGDKNGWQAAFGTNWEEVHPQYVHMLGNLTLTSRNAEMGNKSFREKVTMEHGFAMSGIYINKFILDCGNWGPNEIRERTIMMTDAVLRVFPSARHFESIFRSDSPSSKEVRSSTEENSSIASTPPLPSSQPLPKTQPPVQEWYVSDNEEIPHLSGRAHQLLNAIKLAIKENFPQIKEYKTKSYTGYKERGKVLLKLRSLSRKVVVKVFFTTDKEAFSDIYQGKISESTESYRPWGKTYTELHTEEDLGWFLHLANEALQHQLKKDEG